MSATKFITRPDGVHQPPGNAFSHAVVASGLVYTSGQVGINPDGLLLDGFEGQAKQAFENLNVVLGACGAGLADVVKVTVLVAETADVRRYLPIAARYLAHRPASTLHAVKAFAMPGLLFEVDAVAVLPR
ncbi:RidA family protein [Amycolatopsis sp. cmx-4-68]|uniref:RidA family protein n=1 Tax=Amycolatopsis sp. cmx-4-68 TaxID=2790938 RepID=UPI00397E7335